MTRENQELRSALHKANLELGIAKAKCRGLKTEVKELRSLIADSSLQNKETSKKICVQTKVEDAVLQLKQENAELQEQLRRQQILLETKDNEIQELRSSLRKDTPSRMDPKWPVVVAGCKRASGSSKGEPPRKRPHVPGDEADEDGRTELHRAVKDRDTEKVRELLARGFDTRARDRRGVTPLLLALESSDELTAELLADADAGISSQNRYGSSPLHLAALFGYTGIVKKLLAAGADVSLRDWGGCTPLHRSLQDVDIGGVAAELLVDAGSELDARNLSDRTPLHLAAQRGFFQLSKKLLWSGAHPHIRDDMDNYPLTYAIGSEYDIAEVIVQACVMRGIAIDLAAMKIPRDEMQLYVDLVSKCSAEIEKMKDTRIDGTTVSYLDICRQHRSKVASYLRIEAIRKVLLCDRALPDFPNYGDFIIFKVMQAEKRRVLADQCLRCFSLLAQKWPLLPSTCIDLISDFVLRCLDDNDMGNFIRAFQVEC